MNFRNIQVSKSLSVFGRPKKVPVSSYHHRPSDQDDGDYYDSYDDTDNGMGNGMLCNK
jgi:hypothetical protein